MAKPSLIIHELSFLLVRNTHTERERGGGDVVSMEAVAGNKGNKIVTIHVKTIKILRLIN